MSRNLATFIEGLKATEILSKEQIAQIEDWSIPIQESEDNSHGVTGKNTDLNNPLKKGKKNLSGIKKSYQADPKDVIKKLLQTNWLTQLQIKWLWDGKFNDLVLGQYVILEKLGEGGMGEVFRARHQRMQRDVALKVIRKEKLGNAEAVKRFEREVQSAAQLNHENVVMAYDAAHHRDILYFAMELVDGITLSQKVKEEGPLPIVKACQYIRQASLGLQHAYERGLIHRDIKPSNILLTKNEIVKLLDLGLARTQTAHPDDPSQITAEGIVLGTPDFISPEQARNSHETDIRSDIYSLGCTLYWLLTGSPPYPEGTPTEKLLQHVEYPTPMITSVRADIPPLLEQIIAKMMAKNPADRFQTPLEIIKAISPFCDPNFRTISPTINKIDAPQHNPFASISFTEPESMSDSGNRNRAEPALVVSPLSRRPKENTRPWWIGPWIIVTMLMIVAIIILLIRPSSNELTDHNYDSLSQKLQFPEGLDMVLIPTGKFEMGAGQNDPDRERNEMPMHPIEIPFPFYISIHEITRQQFKTVMNSDPSQNEAKGIIGNLPVDSVRFSETQHFCEKLNDSPDWEKPRGYFFRLPTEAEWEYTCRAGTKTPFSCGDQLTGTYATFLSSGKPVIHPVGLKEANPWGVFDMHGNLFEWTNDFYSEVYYMNSPIADPPGPTTGNKRTVRGGSFKSPAPECRSPFRMGLPPEKRNPEVGFRIVLAPPIPKDK